MKTYHLTFMQCDKQNLPSTPQHPYMMVTISRKIRGEKHREHMQMNKLRHTHLSPSLSLCKNQAEAACAYAYIQNYTDTNTQTLTGRAAGSCFGLWCRGSLLSS